MKNKNMNRFVRIAMIAAAYAAVSLSLSPLTFGPVQIRIAEALTLLPLIYEPAILGVTLGCFVTNLVGAAMGTNLLGFMDVSIGTAATFLAAVLTYRLRNVRFRNIPVWSILMPVAVNGIVVGIELGAVLFPNSILIGSLISGLEVAAGELVSVIAGWFLIKALKKTNLFS